jgi:hypothetical protein
MTERRGRVVSTPAWYSGGPGFKSLRGDRLPRLSFFMFFSVPPGKLRETALKLGHDRFIPHYFQLIIHLSSCHRTLYILSY